MGKPILCVDFDGVVHSYSSPWVHETHIPDPPVPGALEWLFAATERFDVQIYSSRSKSEMARIAMLRWMANHSSEIWDHSHPMCRSDWRSTDFDYPVTFAAEKPPAFLTIDDRAICFNGDWSALDPAALLAFKPWNKRNG